MGTYHDDNYAPRNLGHIRPLNNEWDDYIIEEQSFYLAGVACGEIVLPKVKERDARKYKSLGRKPYTYKTNKGETK